MGELLYWIEENYKKGYNIIWSSSKLNRQKWRCPLSEQNSSIPSCAPVVSFYPDRPPQTLSKDSRQGAGLWKSISFRLNRIDRKFWSQSFHRNLRGLLSLCNALCDGVSCETREYHGDLATNCCRPQFTCDCCDKIDNRNRPHSFQNWIPDYIVMITGSDKGKHFNRRYTPVAGA